MHAITNIAAHLAPASLQNAGTNSQPGSSGNGFQLAMSARPETQTSARGVSAGVSALGSQTASTFLQMQDLSQAQAHGGGGGGGHHGSMKVGQGLEVEEAEESEEAQTMRSRKKLLRNINHDGVMETTEVEDGGPIATDVKQVDANKSARNDEEATLESQ